ncbi:MAG: NUDIX domain-containing protein [Pararobbsia sp.]
MPVRHTLMLVMRRGAQVWLQRRAPTGIWGGLWSLPEGEDTATLVRLADRIGIHDSAVELQPLTPISHTFTHFRLEIEPLLLDLPAGAATLYAAEAEEGWVPLAELDAVGLPAPVRKLLLGLTGDAALGPAFAETNRLTASDVAA